MTTTTLTGRLSEADATALAEFADLEIRMICSDGGRPIDSDAVRREARQLILMADLEDALDAGMVPPRTACDICLALIERRAEVEALIGRHPERDADLREEARELRELAMALVAHAEAQVTEGTA